jgi:DNA-binding response OmpR family regulator
MTAPRDMVVDDDADLRRLICDYLAANGYEVCGAANSGEIDTHLRTAITMAFYLT